MREAHFGDDYELIDTGDFEKLERFGPIIVARPETQALWPKALPETEWNKLAHAKFVKGKNQTQTQPDNANYSTANKEDTGQWIKLKPMADQWFIQWLMNDADQQNIRIKMRLGLTPYRHVGIFPEQCDNWHFMANSIAQLPKPPQVLNLFAYTGAASLVARQAGAEVVHVDAVKSTITWANANQTASGVDKIRWMLDDVLKFVKREVRRQHIYQGIILDPPPYGRGPDGEKWLLDKHLPELLHYCAQLLPPKNCFVIMNLYAVGYSALTANNLGCACFSQAQNPDVGELYIPDRAGRKLSFGVYWRFFAS